MTKIFTIAAIGLAFAATAAVAGDGHEAQKKVYEGLLPAQSATAPLENRIAMQNFREDSFDRRSPVREGQANIRIQNEHQERSIAGFGS